MIRSGRQLQTETHASLFDICIACGNQTASIARGRINEFRSVSSPSAVSIARSNLNSLSNTRAFHISASAVANNKQSLGITPCSIFYITFIYYALDVKRFLLNVTFYYVSIAIFLICYIFHKFFFIQNFILSNSLFLSYIIIINKYLVGFLIKE